ncbi:LysR family transcriptional regulator [Granulicoccus phenolivorans]|uniref:LysR family transcriptional regulator n=1 Tax=Granulicoccus phenolivorans TaxID=266854 RepID=UPI0005568A49|nr:LysR family transcriptional regulator [Granulicoccus phenolivorans]
MDTSREPDLEALRALALTAESGSISAAGARLGVSQQAVSLRIRALERDLRVRLLVRSPRGSHLTPAGQLLVGWAAPLLTAADEFTAAARTLHDSGTDTLRIAASLTIAEHLIPEWIARWRVHLGTAGPAVQLSAANSSVVAEAVREGTADLGFIETPAIPADLTSRPIGADTIEVVVAGTHRWAVTRAVSIPELARTPLVLREPGSGTRQTFDDALRTAGHPRTAEPAEVARTTLALRSAVMAGTAPGALSSLAVADDLQAGRLVRVRIRNLRIQRPLTAIWAGRAGPGVRDFLALAPGT